MDDNWIEKKAYLGEPVTLWTGQKFILNIETPRPVEVFAATNEAKTDDKMILCVDSDDTVKRYQYKEEGVEITSAAPLPKDKKCTILIPKSAKEPIFTIFPDGYNSSEGFQFPLKSFLDTLMKIR